MTGPPKGKASPPKPPTDATDDAAAKMVDQMADFLKGRGPVPEPPEYPELRITEDLTPPVPGTPVTWIRLPQGFVTRLDVDSHTGAVPCTVCRWQTVTRCDGPPPLTLDSTRYPAVSNL